MTACETYVNDRVVEAATARLAETLDSALTGLVRGRNVKLRGVVRSRVIARAVSPKRGHQRSALEPIDFLKELVMATDRALMAPAAGEFGFSEPVCGIFF